MSGSAPTPTGQGAQTQHPKPPAVEDVADAKLQKPGPPPNFGELSPTQQMGLQFGRKLICLLSAAGLILLVGWGVLSVAQESYRQSTYDKIVPLLTQPPQTADIDRVIHGIEAERLHPPPADDSIRRTTLALTDEALNNKDTPQWLTGALKRCRTALTASAADGIDDCLTGLNVLKLQSARADLSPERARATVDILKQLGQAQQEQRASWLQLAQTILLNLLLPLLTAVFGYAFGREQANS